MDDNKTQQHITKDIKSLLGKNFFKLIFLSVLLITLAIILDHNDIPKYVVIFFGTIGTTIISAIVVGFVFSDNDYQKLLKEEMVSVMLNPESYRTQSQVTEIWRKITKSMLSSVLPFESDNAVKQIENLLLDDEREYHFEHYEIIFNFTVDESTDELRIDQTVNARIVTSRNCPNPILKQYLTTLPSSTKTLHALRINSDSVLKAIHTSKDPDNGDREIIEYPLNQSVEPNGEQRVASYHRHMTVLQKYSEDPCYSGDLTRYAKGLVIQASVNKGYKILTQGFGKKNSEFPEPEIISIVSSTNQNATNPSSGTQTECKRWTIAKTSELLVPGYGYILIIVKDTENKAVTNNDGVSSI